MQQDPNDLQDFNEENDDEKHESANSGNGDTADSDVVDIDEALKDVGLASDTHDSDPEPLGTEND